MDEAVRIGKRLKQFRLAQRLTLKALAAQVGCSEGMLSKVENGRTSASIDMLHRLVKVLGSNLSSLFEDTLTDTIARAGTRPTLQQGNRWGEITLELLTPARGAALFQASIYIIAPGARTEGKIAHAGEELGYVLEGQLELELGSDIHHLKTGDSFFFPSDVPHGYRNPGLTETRLIWFNSPATF